MIDKGTSKLSPLEYVAKGGFGPSYEFFGLVSKAILVIKNKSFFFPWFHVNSSKNNFIVSTTNMAVLSRGYKPRMPRTDLSGPLLWYVTLDNLKLLGRLHVENHWA